jgi:hypothetical protein
MAVPTPTSTTPYSIGALEGAAVSFLGAFAGAFTLAGATLTGSILTGAVAFAAYLGYHAYQNS